MMITASFQLSFEGYLQGSVYECHAITNTPRPGLHAYTLRNHGHRIYSTAMGEMEDAEASLAKNLSQR